MDNRMLLNTVISATAGGILGGAITFLTVKKVIQDRANAEIAEVREYYRLVRKEDGSLGNFGDGPTTVNNFYEPDPGIAAEEVARVAKEIIGQAGYSGVPIPSESVVNQMLTKNVFDDPIDESEVGDEIGTEPEEAEDGVDETPEHEGYVAEEDKPVLISREVFEEGDPRFEPETLTYYELDDTLCDSRDETIDDSDYVVGDKHLQMFGVESGDPNVVYVRNENIGADFEIIRNQGAYASAILGVPEEDLGLKKPKNRPQKMREHD